MNIAVDVVNVSKQFKLYDEKFQSLKERLLHAGRTTHVDFSALTDVNFSVIEGETVGILGRNGSGKSTLLKCVSGILQPTTGQVRVRGQLAALLELGAGFQPELSGRDNVFLNAALLGLSQKEMERRFDDIVAFAELEQFIDNQVKFYSSGMYVRLGFAVAVNVDPDVLVVDEVLAVGDEAFQQKCLDRIKTFQRRRTHDPVRDARGGHGAPDLRQGGGTRGRPRSGRRGSGPGDQEVQGTPSRVGGGDRDTCGSGSVHPGPGGGAEAGDDLVSGRGAPRVGIAAVPGVDGAAEGEDRVRGGRGDAGRGVRDRAVRLGGQPGVQTDTEILDTPFDAQVGSGRAEFLFESIPLMDGTFYVNVGVQSKGGVVYDWREQATSFEVMNPGRSTGSVALPVHAEIRSAASA